LDVPSNESMPINEIEPQILYAAIRRRFKPGTPDAQIARQLEGVVSRSALLRWKHGGKWVRVGSIQKLREEFGEPWFRDVQRASEAVIVTGGDEPLALPHATIDSAQVDAAASSVDTVGVQHATESREDAIVPDSRAQYRLMRLVQAMTDDQCKKAQTMLHTWLATYEPDDSTTRDNTPPLT
jgi:hypothetical protein